MKNHPCCFHENEKDQHPAQFELTKWCVNVREGNSLFEQAVLADRWEVEDGIARFYRDGLMIFAAKEFVSVGVYDPAQHDVTEDDPNEPDTENPGEINKMKRIYRLMEDWHQEHCGAA